MMRFASLIVCIALLTAAITVRAEISIRETDDGQLSVSATDERNDALLEALGRELGFRAEILDETWAAERRNFARTDVPEKIVRSLLAGTSTLFGYGAPDADGQAPIMAVTVISPGTAGPMPDPIAARSGLGLIDPGLQGFTQKSATLGAEAPRGKDSVRKPAPVGTSPAATTEREEEPGGVAALLAARARPAGVAVRPSAAPSAASSAALPAGEIDQAQLQRLTQQAHQDVQALAAALRQAESQLGADPQN